ncbi:MAG TPA: lipoate protein ligase C-terminal domain-containing protein, partial [Anaerovoracaceae bacterium]|nr:lipoate protein ligase C-terminal domain-containing protein [Anaerovoracaceae bacterium]
TIEIGLNAESGHIQEANIYGDFFVDAPIEELIQKLIHLPYDKMSIQKALGATHVGSYIWGLDNATFVENLLQK